jgi:hypothetical protein
MTQTLKKGQGKDTVAGVQKKPRVSQFKGATERKGAAPVVEAPTAKTGPADAPAAKAPTFTLDEDLTLFRRAWVYTLKNYDKILSATAAFTKKWIMAPINYMAITCVTVLPLATAAVFIIRDEIVKQGGQFTKIPVALVNGLHNAAMAAKPFVAKWTDPNHIWITIGAIVGLFVANAAVAAWNKAADDLVKKREQEQQQQ